VKRHLSFDGVDSVAANRKRGYGGGSRIQGLSRIHKAEVLRLIWFHTLAGRLITVAAKLLRQLEGSDIEIHNVANKHDIVDGVHESTPGDIHEKLQHASDIHEKVQETLMDDDLFQQDSVVDCQQDPYYVIDC
nr:hypothetical protein [Tanacetum cinerariifolium]